MPMDSATLAAFRCAQRGVAFPRAVVSEAQIEQALAQCIPVATLAPGVQLQPCSVASSSGGSGKQGGSSEQDGGGDSSSGVVRALHNVRELLQAR